MYTYQFDAINTTESSLTYVYMLTYDVFDTLEEHQKTIEYTRSFHVAVPERQKSTYVFILSPSITIFR